MFITSTTVVLEGDKVNLTCNVINDSDAMADSLQVYWYHNGIQLTTNKSDRILVYESDQVTSQV